MLGVPLSLFVKDDLTGSQESNTRTEEEITGLFY